MAKNGNEFELGYFYLLTFTYLFFINVMWNYMV